MSSPDRDVDGGDAPGTGRRRGQIYGRRSGHKLRPAQAGLVETLLPRLRVSPEDLARAPLEDLFGPDTDAVWLEIGFGGAEHLLWHAARNPRTGFIGIEPFVNGVAKLLTGVEAEGLNNIRVNDGDARLVLAALPDASLSRAFVLFPDPWHKKRHNKRRIVNRATLAELARILKPGAELRIASDIPDYVRWIMAHIRDVPEFVWTAERPADWRMRPDDWPETRYEQKAVREGRKPSYLSFRRR